MAGSGVGAQLSIAARNTTSLYQNRTMAGLMGWWRGTSGSLALRDEDRQGWRMAACCLPRASSLLFPSRPASISSSLVSSIKANSDPCSVQPPASADRGSALLPASRHFAPFLFPLLLLFLRSRSVLGHDLHRPLERYNPSARSTIQPPVTC